MHERFVRLKGASVALLALLLIGSTLVAGKGLIKGEGGNG